MRSFPPPIMGRKVRFVVVGCGRIAQSHFGALREHSSVAELVDVCDIDEDAVGAAGNLMRARTWTNLSEMLLATDADVVVLTMPSGLHSEQPVMVAGSGYSPTPRRGTRPWTDGHAVRGAPLGRSQHYRRRDQGDQPERRRRPEETARSQET